jgi:hypothetical protein
MALVSLGQAKDHLRIEHDYSDADIVDKMEQASAIVVDFLTTQADPTWDELTVPKPVQTAILWVLAHLWAHRGDEVGKDDELWAALNRLLARFRDPAYA